MPASRHHFCPVLFRPRFAVLLAIVAASCTSSPPAGADHSLADLGPLRLGMSAEQAHAALKEAGIEMFCTEGRPALTFCERQNNREPVQVAYGLMDGRVSYLMRHTRSAWAGENADSLVAQWEARLGPSLADSTPAPAHVTVFRYWYEPGHAFRSVTCSRRSDRVPKCQELAVDPTVSSVSALVMSVAMERSGDIVCHNWEELVTADCTRREDLVPGRGLATGEVIRSVTIRGGRPAPPAGARTVLDYRGERFHYQVRQAPDGRLHGSVCWENDGVGGCRAIVARYEPKAFLAAFTRNAR
jgi:hypothetical protein